MKFQRLLLLYREGQMLVELGVAMGVAAIFLPVLISGLVATREGRPQQQQRLTALTKLREAEEATRSVREKGWNVFAQNGTFHPENDGSSWSLVSGSSTVNGFTTSVTISDVSRNTVGAIVTSGGTVDPSTKRVVTTVSWLLPIPANVSSTKFLTRMDNITFTTSTEAELNPGTKTNTYVINTQGGEVVLGAGGGGGDWCLPSKSITQYDLPKSGVANAITAIEGRIFAGTGQSSDGVSFADVRLSINNDPPNVLGSKTFDGYKTNGVFGEENYAYLATDNNSKEFVIMDLNQYSDPPTNSKYKEVGVINVDGARDGNSLYVVNNKAYLLADDRLFIYVLNADRTTATLQNATSGYQLSGNGKKIYVGNNEQYAYVITDATSNQFEIINVSNMSAPTRSSIRTIGTNQAGIDAFITPTETTAYIAVAYSAGRNNVYKVDITVKSNPVIGSGYSTNGMNPKGITVVSGNWLIVVGTGGTYQYQVLNSTTMALCSPTSVLSYSTGVNGVASVLQANGYAYSYIITGDDNAELKIILGGAGGQFVSSGTYESPTFNSNYSTAFNRFSATVSKPTQTDITIRVAVAQAVNGSCSNAVYSFLGPGGDASAYYTTGSDPTIIEGAIPLLTSGTYVNPGQCFRFRAYLSTTDSTASPELQDFTVNYSP